jgi:hypothetical protein
MGELENIQQFGWLRQVIEVLWQEKSVIPLT